MNTIQGEKFSSLADVARHCRQHIKFQILIQPHNPCPRQAIQPFVGANGRPSAGDGDFLIAFEIAHQQEGPLAFSLHAIGNTKSGQRLSGLLRTIGRVGIS